jgi:PPOX class probable FMN-dependent enzyme
LSSSDLSAPFPDVVASLDDLRSRYREPSKLVRAKKQPVIDDGVRSIIAASPFVLLSTSAADGRCDVSPRGGPPGFVKVLDDRRLALPDLNGNNLLDSLTNIIENHHAGLLFVIPGRDETLRVDGRAWITEAPGVLDLFVEELRRPKVAIGIEIEAVFIHCAKAFRRGRVWDPAAWAELEAKSALEVLACQLDLTTPMDELQVAMEAGYARDLAADLPER